MKKKTIKAWAVINKDGEIPENDDDPKFLCVHKTKKEAMGAKLRSEDVVKVEINLINKI